MLIVRRKIGERVTLAGEIVVTVLAVDGSRVKLGIDAPPHVTILRDELIVETTERTVPVGPIIERISQ